MADLDDPTSDGSDGIGFFDFKEAIDTGMPRVFLLPGAGEDRDAKVVTRNRAFSSDKPHSRSCSTAKHPSWSASTRVKCDR